MREMADQAQHLGSGLVWGRGINLWGTPYSVQPAGFVLPSSSSNDENPIVSDPQEVELSRSITIPIHIMDG